MQHSIWSLNGAWQLYYRRESKDMPATLDEVKRQGWPGIEAVVPGNVELDLVRAGIEQDPFVGTHLYDFRKYEYYQWWFERSFELPSFDAGGKQLVLRFHGLDTFGTIWVNGREAGRTDNMLIAHELDITAYALPGQTNHIAVRIASPLNAVRDKPYPAQVYGSEHGDELVWLRKPPSAFGWDIAPRLVSAGMWRDVELELRDVCRITEAYYATQWVRNDVAQLVVRYRFAAEADDLDGFSVRLTGRCGAFTLDKEAKCKFVSDGFTVQVPSPRLWWPRGYGDAALYEVTLELLRDGQVVDRRSERIGIRTVELETKYAEGDAGEFRFKVNGVPVQVKGTNWVPLDALHSRDRDRLAGAHALLTDLHCNMARCWGGNVYEDHAFFELCDEAGVMVWQDFALACAAYPQNDEFADMLEREASSVVVKLRNHPSIVVWAGDNEIDQMYSHWGYTLPHARLNRLNREVLPRTVGSHDPYRHYIPSSPYIPEHMSGDLTVPEQHNWGPRDYYKGDFYKHTTAHFISEIGYHGCPAVSSIKRFISPERLWPYANNDEWDTHNTENIRRGRRGYNRNELMGDQVKILFGEVPAALDRFALASQISQAEAKKFFIEMVRLKKWRRTGVIWWNLLDAWPQFSDAVVDYYFTKKLAYHYIKRVQRPVCLMMGELERWHHPVVLANDSRRPATVTYRVEDGETGETLLAGTAFCEAGGNVQVGAIKAWEGAQKLYLLHWDDAGEQGANHYISGYVPFELARYERWLSKIAALPEPFASEACYL